MNSSGPFGRTSALGVFRNAEARRYRARLWAASLVREAGVSKSNLNAANKAAKTERPGGGHPVRVVGGSWEVKTKSARNLVG